MQPQAAALSKTTATGGCGARKKSYKNVKHIKGAKAEKKCNAPYYYSVFAMLYANENVQ